MTALREEMKRKAEELLTSVESLSIMEGALKKKDEVLELSRELRLSALISRFRSTSCRISWMSVGSK